MELRDLRIGKGINPTLIKALGGEERIRIAMKLAIHAVGARFSFFFPATVERIVILGKQNPHEEGVDSDDNNLQIAGQILPPSEITFSDTSGARYTTRCWTRTDFSVLLRTRRI